MKSPIATMIQENTITNLRILVNIGYLNQTDLRQISGLLYRRMKTQEDKTK